MLILVVDDQPTMAAALMSFLRTLGYETRATSSGEQALRIIHEDKPSLVLLDLNLPGLSGSEMLRILRGDHRFDSLPVVICSAQDRLASEDLQSLGAQAFVSKSDVFEQLGRVIERQLQGS